MWEQMLWSLAYTDLKWKFPHYLSKINVGVAFNFWGSQSQKFEISVARMYSFHFRTENKYFRRSRSLSCVQALRDHIFWWLFTPELQCANNPSFSATQSALAASSVSLPNCAKNVFSPRALCWSVCFCASLWWNLAASRGMFSQRFATSRRDM